ncbi:gamma-glutamyltransferase [Tsuneonella suprasediminis]|uniref:Glutathione hydrolase proenzyme n=1 Tax=Tsuneonella suprasediminis TaxID=2306996 RepID=A0A419R5T1_9SPHN|nr:gamma-glutamyltransferase [Tsuneonella suprasediminis]RJX70903.1 gamma-glutamyltransferase [Tsuneonella suprasediminis]
MSGRTTLSLRGVTHAAAIALVLFGSPLAAKQPAPPVAQAPAAAPTQEQAYSRTGGDIVGYDSIHHPVIGHGGMVVSQNAYGTRAGAEILRRGGNAVDAAVTVALVEAVSLARAGNIGGGGFMLIHMAAADGKPASTTAIDYYGVAPRKVTPDLLLDANGKFDRDKGWSFKGVAVPGTVAGLWAAHERFGKLPWANLVQPAIDLATNGVILSDAEAEATAQQSEALARDPGARAAYLKPDGTPYKAGDLFRQPDLAKTLTAIRDHGRDGFYKGWVAKKLVAAMKANGGIIDQGDLDAYRADVSPPIWSSYRGHPVAYMPPTASGVSVAEAMNILEHYPVGEMGWGSVANLHLLSETMKIVTSDRRLVGGKPDWNTPSKGLASKEFAAQRAALIKPDSALDEKSLPEGNPYPFESKDTTHYSVADASGNAVSNTYTLSASYGAHVVAPGTGFLLNNSLGNLAWGARGKEYPATQVVPGKRVGSTITPIIVFDKDKPWLVTGTPGGGTIIATMVQLLSNVIDHRLNVAEAAQRPRINQSDADRPMEMESGYSPDIARLLEEKGHKVVPSRTMGSTQSIMIEGDRFLGAADTRRPDALAVGVTE